VQEVTSPVDGSHTSDRAQPDEAWQVSHRHTGQLSTRVRGHRRPDNDGRLRGGGSGLRDRARRGPGRAGSRRRASSAAALRRQGCTSQRQDSGSHRPVSPPIGDPDRIGCHALLGRPYTATVSSLRPSVVCPRWLLYISAGYVAWVRWKPLRRSAVVRGRRAPAERDGCCVLGPQRDHTSSRPCAGR